jgi:hypothetical protein
VDTEIIKWLLNGDPSIQFYTKRDLLQRPTKEIESSQVQIQNEGWGKRLLSYQEDSGMWGGNLYSPKWISTHYTLMTLMRLGLSEENQQAKKGCKLLLEKGFYKDGGINYFTSLKHSETCVTGMTLALQCYFEIDDDRINSLKDFILEQQLSDGGWNCESFNGAKHSSFHTTISVLEGLRQFEKKKGKDVQRIIDAREKAHEFLLQHHLFRSDKTGEVVDQRMTRFSFPPRWKYDVMRALDYFQELNTPHDPRFCDGITLIKKKEKKGKWPLQQKHNGLVFFDMEPIGQSSRMNTLRALRILKWWTKKPEEIKCKV